jgi:hypothetical protein
MRSPKRSLKILGGLHAFFFITSAFFIFFIRQTPDSFMALGFLFTGFSSLAAYLFIETNPKAGIAGALGATIIYWTLAFHYEQYSGFINGISITISLMGITGIWLIFRTKE